MPKKFLIPYLLIFFTLLLIMSISRPISEKIRGDVISILAPMWEKIIEIKAFVFHPELSESKFEPIKGKLLLPSEEIQRLQLENQLLTNELSFLNNLLNEKQLLSNQIKILQDQGLSELSLEAKNYQNYLQRLTEKVQFKLHALPARVIFRSFDSWNYSLWVNVGKKDNESYGFSIVAKNSPVLVGDSIVGVIDYVGQFQSRVRLITDSALTPAVRAVRGGEQESLMVDHIELLLSNLNRKKYTFFSSNDQESLINLLSHLKTTLQPMKKSWYLAKGELKGSSSPLARSHSQILRGTGFNYDFSDEEGEGRDLRTGKVIQNSDSVPIPILKLNDILVTSGMDGIFPSSFKIATVTKIELLKEGDYFYELEAKPTAGNLNELSLVFIIPPLGYDKEDREIK